MKYHPDIELLLKYTNGQLPASLAVAIGIHQHECKICQERIADIECIGGETMEVSQTDSLAIGSSKSFEQLMADISHIEQEEEISDYSECAVAELDRPILTQLGDRNFANFTWKKVTPWIQKAEVPLEDEGFQIELLKFAPNAKIPKHTHEGEEVTLVLEGDFSDINGVYQEGEFIVQDSTHEHQPIAGSNGCICLAITTAPLKFTGALGPVLNWFTR